MKKKILIKALAIAVLAVGVVLLGLTVRGILEGNRYYDLFRKIGVNIHDVYSEIDNHGLDAVKDTYRNTFAVVDEMDALGAGSIQADLDDVNTAYGLVDTIEATESIVTSINLLGGQQAQDSLNDVYDAISEAEKTFAAVKAVGAENAGTYMEDIAAALEAQPEDLAAARAALDSGYADLDEDIAKQVKKFFDFVFQQVESKGREEALAYMDQALDASEQTSEEFAEGLIGAKYADAEDETAGQIGIYCGDVFRLINDQGTAQAKTYIQHILDTLKEKDIPDARAYLDEVYADNKENHTTRLYLDSIFQLMDSQGAEYAKLHGGEICAQVNQAAVDEAQQCLNALDDAAKAAVGQATALDRLGQVRNAMEAAGDGIDPAGNRYLAAVYAINDEIEKAVSAADRAQKKAEKSVAAIDSAKEKAEEAQAAVSSAATEEEKAAATEAAEKAQKDYDSAVAKAQKDQDDAEKKKLNEEKARQYVNRLEEAIAAAAQQITPESRQRTLEFQNHVCDLIEQLDIDTEKKFIEKAYEKVYDEKKQDKTLRLTRLGTDNAKQLDALDGAKASAMRNKAQLMMLTVACLIIGIMLLCIKVNDYAQPKLTREERAQMGHHMGLKTSRMIANSAIHAVLIIISVVWLIPFISIVLQSLRVESTHQVGYIMPDKLHFYNYVDLFGTDFPRWYANTFIMALIVAVLQTVIVLCMSYTLSRFRFKMRKPLMRFMLILGMFPGMLTMIILYRVLSDLGLTQANAVPGLILVYIASSGMGYYVSKGFFDTIPKSLDEAARVDGATRFQVLKKIILPLSKPIVIYTILTAFMGPWGDYVFARYISFGTSAGMNVAVGLYSWLSKDQIASRYTMFCAGGVLVAIPVAVLFMCLQKYYVEGVTGGAVKG